jgi:two-component system, cell cycle response regulator
LATITALQATVESLPTIPETLARILRLVDDPDAGVAKLAAVLHTDAPLSANLLRLANSVYYRRSREVRMVADAVNLLGFRVVRQVALGASVVSMFGREAGRRGGALEYREIWRHGIATAALARHLAPSVGVRDAELAFTGGLLHDLGKFVLNLHSRREYDAVIAARRESRRDLVEEERLAFGYDHTELGAAMGSAWYFPEDLVICCGDHHTRPRTAGMPGLIALADQWAHRLMPARCDLGHDPDRDDAADLCAVFGLSSAELVAREREFRAAIATAAEIAPAA